MRRPGRFVLAADTIVVAPSGKIFGKPENRIEAVRFLRSLAGKTHTVTTAVAVAVPGGQNGGKGSTAKFRIFAGLSSTRVTFRAFDFAAARGYAATGECDDKAGAYAIQGIGALLVRRINGNFSNVVGLPIPLTVDLLVKAGAPIGDLVRSVAFASPGSC